MDFRQVSYFLAVAELGSYRRASEHLNIAQSALSRHVIELEQRIGAPLFDRFPRGVRLTAAGQAYYQDARLAIDRMERAVERSRRAGLGEIGRIAIAVNDIGARHPVIADQVGRFRSAWPDIELEFFALNSQDQTQALHAGSVDLAVMADAPKLSSFERLELGTDPFVLAFPHAHALAKASTITVDILRGQPFVAVRTASHRLPQTRLWEQCRGMGLEPYIVQEVVNEQMQLAFIRAGVGIGFINASLRPFLPSDVASKEVVGLTASLTMTLVWDATRDAPARERLIAALRSSPEPSTIL